MENLLLPCLLHPEGMLQLSLSQWETLVWQARSASLLGRILVLLEARGALAAVPSGPRRHLEWQRALLDSQHRAVRWEVACLKKALAELEQPFILLKGAAYVMADLPVAAGRTFSDVDILVAREELAGAENLLLRHGWVSAKPHPYDQRYFRQWMHELPPLRHGARGTVVDVHHGLRPLTARRHPEPALLLEAARPIPGQDGLWCLSPADMVLHAACHLFHEGEFQRGLRDLSDLDQLLRHFSGVPGFWQDLTQRSRLLDLARPLHYALRYTRLLLGTPVPPGVRLEAESAAPAPLLAVAMDRLFLPMLGRAPGGLPRIAGSLLYFRGHALRMPLWLLVPHLLRKTWREWSDEDARA